MPQWVSAAEIVERYAVGEAKLLQYSARGNLPCRRAANGMFFDLDHVARLFRLRSAVVSADPDAREFGRLGKLQLGHVAAPVEQEPTQAAARRQRLVQHAQSSVRNPPIALPDLRSA